MDRPDDFGGSPDYGLSAKCVSEFIGAYARVFIIGLNVLGGVPAGAWSIAASLIRIVYALGNCSGAPFNQAVTVAIRLSGRDRCSPGEGAASVCATTSAASCARWRLRPHVRDLGDLVCYFEDCHLGGLVGSLR